MKVIWALARNTILQALRMKTAITLILLFLLAAPLLMIKTGPANTGEVRSSFPIRVEADGTQAGEVKFLLTYNITIASGLLMALTMLLSATVLDKEITSKQIFLVCAKPVKRWQILLGKWLGIVILNAWLLIIMGSITVLLVWYFARLDYGRPEGYREVRQQVLTSRRSVRPPEFDVDAIIADQKKRMREEGLTDQEINSRGVEATIKRNIERKHVRIRPWRPSPFYMSNVPMAENPNETLYTIRYKLYTVESKKVPVRCEWYVGTPDGTAFVRRRTENRAGDFREFTVPAAVVDKNGRTVIVCRNLTVTDPRFPDSTQQTHTLAIAVPDGLEILAPSGSFLSNFSKGMALLLIRLATVAAIGVSASALLSAPVGALLLITLMAYGYGGTFLASTLEKANTRNDMATAQAEALTDEKPNPFENVYNSIAPFLRKTFIGFTHLPPDFNKTDPTEDLSVGREILLVDVGYRAFMDLVIRGGLAFLLGTFFIYRRELARPNL